MTVNLPQTAILGAGAMGGAILRGLLQPGVQVDGTITVTNRTAAKADAIDHPSVTSLALERDPEANRIAVRGARLVLIGVKPALVPDTLAGVSAALEPGALVVSLAAGIPIAAMEALVEGPVVRAMPNTPAVVGRAVTGLAAGGRASAADVALARTLFETVGTVLEVPEDRIDELSAISGSGPAWVYLFVAELTRVAQDLGFTPEEARTLVEQTWAGSMEYLLASGRPPEELRREVTSPKGTTERAIAVLQDAQLGELFERAARASIARAKELAAGA